MEISNQFKKLIILFQDYFSDYLRIFLLKFIFWIIYSLSLYEDNINEMFWYIFFRQLDCITYSSRSYFLGIFQILKLKKEAKYNLFISTQPLFSKWKFILLYWFSFSNRTINLTMTEKYEHNFINRNSLENILNQERQS